MKSLALCSVAALLCLAGCRTSVTQQHNHWRASHVAPRLSHHFLAGYDAYEDGRYVDFRWEETQNINRTIQRHFLNTNYDNPFQPDDPNRFRPRPAHSILPYPWRYIHLEGLALGALLLNPTTDMFITLPVGALIATLDRGGKDEFVDGLETTFEPLGVLTASFVHHTIGRKSFVRAVWSEFDCGGGEEWDWHHNQGATGECGEQCQCACQGGAE